MTFLVWPCPRQGQRSAIEDPSPPQVSGPGRSGKAVTFFLSNQDHCGGVHGGINPNLESGITRNLEHESIELGF